MNRTIYYALILLTAFLAGSAFGQEATPQAGQPTPTSTPQASPTAIPFADVITQAENADSSLREIAAGASPDAATAAVEQDLPALVDEINARLDETARTVEGSTSLDSLRSFEADWRTLTKDLPGWRNDLIARARELEGDLTQLDDLISRWEKTLGELRSTDAPPEIITRIEEILRASAVTRQLITGERTRVIALQNRLAEQQTRVNEALKTIGARREALVGQLLVRDSPAFWDDGLWEGSDILGGMNASLATQMDGLKAFGERNKDKLIVHLLIFAALAGILYYLRRRARPIVEANPELKQAAVIFYLPIPTALLLAIVFSTQIYPQTPQILGAIFGAIALVPTVIILRKLLGNELYPLLYALVIFYFVDQLRAIFDAVPAVARPLFAIEMAAAIPFFWWFSRHTARREEETQDAHLEKVLRVARVAAVIVLPFFAVSLAANAFGYANLSRLVGSGVLRSAYAALILYAAVRIMEGLVAFALRFWPLNLLKMARDRTTEIQATVSKIVRWIALALWVLATLEQFTLREIVFREARRILTAELSLGSISISAADVLLFFIVVWAAFMISRFIRFALEEDVYPRFSLAHGIPYAISTVINYLILLGGFFLAVGAAGLDLTRVTVLVGAFGVGIGFGLQNIFNNFVSGLILLFERPVKVGDEIRVGSETGTVKRIGIRASHVRQWDHSEIIVPNSMLISENVKNWSLYARKRGIEIPVSVEHGTNSDDVRKLLIEAAVEHPLVSEKPAPQVIINDLSTGALSFRLRAWTSKTDQSTSIATEITLAITRKMAENGIELLHTTPPATAK